MVERALDLWLLTAVKRHFQNDLFAAQRKIFRQKHSRHAAGPQQRQEAEFLEILTGFGKTREPRAPTSRLAEQAMVLKLRDQRAFPVWVSIAKQVEIRCGAALFVETVFLVNQAQHTAIRSPQLGELLEIIATQRASVHVQIGNANPP